MGRSLRWSGSWQSRPVNSKGGSGGIVVNEGVACWAAWAPAARNTAEGNEISKE